MKALNLILITSGKKSKGGAVFSITRGLCDIARVITFPGFSFQRL